jgi:hypothetical protein
MTVARWEFDPVTGLDRRLPDDPAKDRDTVKPGPGFDADEVLAARKIARQREDFGNPAPSGQSATPLDELRRENRAAQDARKWEEARTEDLVRVKEANRND